MSTSLSLLSTGSTHTSHPFSIVITERVILVGNLLSVESEGQAKLTMREMSCTLPSLLDILRRGSTSCRTVGMPSRVSQLSVSMLSPPMTVPVSPSCILVVMSSLVSLCMTVVVSIYLLYDVLYVGCEGCVLSVVLVRCVVGRVVVMLIRRDEGECIW